ncbi:MAG: hypothetical protein RI988_1958, partial [Pseudomonadota bacterium]
MAVWRCPGFKSWLTRLLACVATLVAIAGSPARAQAPSPDLNLSEELRALFRPSAASASADGPSFSSINGVRYVKAVIWMHAPADPEFNALRAWITDSSLSGSQRGSVHYRYRSFPAMAVVIPVARLQALSNQPGVRYITSNRIARRNGLAYESLARTTGRLESARSDSGLTGAGVGLAILDSGIDFRHAALPDLAAGPAGRKVAGRVDIVGTRRAVLGDGWRLGVDASAALRAELDIRPEQFTMPGKLAPRNAGNAAPAIPDPYGHGTHVATAAAGAAIASGVQSGGLAPGARLFDVRVLDEGGSGEMADVLAGLDWVIQRARHSAFNIRVANLSLGASSTDSYLVDPLARAARTAVATGITVVAAAGNVGKDESGRLVYGSILSPGHEPSVLTVGAANMMSTARRDDDAVTSFSSKGPTRGRAYTQVAGTSYRGWSDNLIKPDIVAPGNRVVAGLASDATPDRSGWNLLALQNPSLPA